MTSVQPPPNEENFIVGSDGLTCVSGGESNSVLMHHRTLCINSAPFFCPCNEITPIDRWTTITPFILLLMLLFVLHLNYNSLLFIFIRLVKIFPLFILVFYFFLDPIVISISLNSYFIIIYYLFYFYLLIILERNRYSIVVNWVRKSCNCKFSPLSWRILIKMNR